MLRFRSLKHFFVISLSLLGMSVSSAYGAILNVDSSGNLLGASAIDVDGTLYDVEFSDGSCISLFSPCLSTDDFVFDTQASTVSASLALLQQVFQDDFSLFPGKTNGCDFLLVTCNVVTPYAPTTTPLFVQTVWARNQAGFAADSVISQLYRRDLNTAPDFTYAVWSTVSPVPVPAAVWLFGTAFIGLLGFSKRKSKAGL